MTNKSIQDNALHYRSNDDEYDIVKIKKSNININKLRRHRMKLLLRQMRDIFNYELDAKHLVLKQNHNSWG